jgi:hypothetical protein
MAQYSQNHALACRVPESSYNFYSSEHELSQLGNNDAVGRVLYTSSAIAAHNKRGIKHADE